MHTTLVLDINSGSVGAGLVGISPRALPVLLATVRKDFFGGREFMMLALNEVLEKISKDGMPVAALNGFPASLDHVLIALSAPWSKGREFNEEENALVNRIENAIIRAVGVKRGACIEHFPSLSSEVVASVFKPSKQVIVVNFMGEVTEYVIREKEKLIHKGRIGFGPYSLANALAQRFELPPVVAHSHLSLYTKGMLESSLRDAIEAIISELEDEWLRVWKAEHSLWRSHMGEVLLVSNPRDFNLGRSLISSAIPRARIITLSDSNCGSYIARGRVADNPLAILAAFSKTLV